MPKRPFASCTRIIYALIASICLPAFLQAQDVKVWLEPTTCELGDPVELHAQLEGSEFAEFSLQIPKHEALYFVSQQSLPVSYNGETYLQKTVWQLQATTPGAIELTDILATIQSGAVTREQTIDPQVLTVTAYEATEDADSPLSLPYDTIRESEQSSFMAWIIASAAFAIGLWVLFSRNKGSNTANANQASEPTLADLATELEAGRQALDMIESILNNPRIELSQEARSTLERAGYGNGNAPDTDALLAQIRKEPSV
ncbi:MAG: hypothetical protein ACN4GF_09420 [Lentimonas sp.]